MFCYCHQVDAEEEDRGLAESKVLNLKNIINIFIFNNTPKQFAWLFVLNKKDFSSESNNC